MSLIGTFVGALLALLPARRPDEDGDAAPSVELQRALRRITRLECSRANLIEHIEMLEDELRASRRLTAEARGERDALRSEVERLWQERAIERAHPLVRAVDQDQINRAFALGMAQAQASQNMALAQQAQAAQQMQNYAMAQQGQQGQQLGSLQQDGRFCNCVPSRSQVWAQVERLNEAE